MIESASTTFTRLGPSTATRAIASRMPGNAISTSITRLITSSTGPPKYPASDPNNIPSVDETETTEMPTSSEIRAPCRSRARMSRPSSSSPSGCARLGASSLRASSWAVGSYGQSDGPARAAAIARIMMNVPTRIISLQPYSRIEKPVGDIGQQIHRHIRDRDEQDAPLNERVIAKVDRLNQQPSDSRPGKDRFGDDGPGEHGPELQPDDGDDRNEAV